MKKGQIVEAIVEKVAFPNTGIAQAEGEEKPLIVKNVIPGQKVRAMVGKIRKGKAEGRILEVVEKSPLETEPQCPHFQLCGGCTYQNLPYERQLELKEKQVRELLDSVCKDYLFEGIKASPEQFFYRNKMEFSFGDEYKDGPLTLGMHKRGGFYDIVTVGNCQIVDEDFCRILLCALSFFADRNIGYYHKLSHQGYLRHLLVRKAKQTREILIDLVTAPWTEGDCETEIDFPGSAALTEQKWEQGGMAESEPLRERQLLQGLTEALRGLDLDGKITGILHTVNDSPADIIRNDGTKILYGKDYFYEELLGLRFRISPFSFFQTNSLGAEVLYETVRGYVGDTKDRTIFDLYSGTGTIAQILAPVAKKVVGVEIVEEAVEAARENAAANGLDNCEFLVGDVLKVIDSVTDRPDIIILDPPRDGIHPKALGKIIAFGVDKIVYISCKPTSLARDLAVFQENGYRVDKVCCVDLFPGTYHVETVCLLSKLNVKHHIEVELTMGEMDLTTAESKATYEEIKNYVKEKTGLQVSNLYIAQIKRKCGIIERINYNLPKSETSRQPKCPPEKEIAIRAALEYFKMI